MKPSGAVWDIFARTRKEPALHHIGDVLAPSSGLAKAYAYQMYQESVWHDMLAVARADIVTLVNDREPTGAAATGEGPWEIYGRRRGEEALTRLGAKARLAGAAAAYGQGWLEMAAFPAAKAARVLWKTAGKER